MVRNFCPDIFFPTHRRPGSFRGTMKPMVFLVAFLFFLLPNQNALPQTAPGGEEKVKLDVPYEPSSQEVVEAMLELAQVGQNDLVYDLGCGDGRIVIAAVRKAGARGVGVDLDPQRIKESLENARKANVSDRVQFLQQDLFQTDFRQATVVMMYLYPEVNLKLRPKLFRELKPDTRIVSHSHDMGTWEPDQRITAPGGHTIHFWVIPANVTGTWEWNLPGEKERHVLKLSQKFQKVSGTLQSGSDEIPIKNLELRGDRLQFTFERLLQGQTETRIFTGRVDGHLIEGTEEEIPTGPQGKRSWKANRNPSSMKALDVD
jgi:SAM-dependent methyltransferase